MRIYSISNLTQKKSAFIQSQNNPNFAQNSKSKELLMASLDSMANNNKVALTEKKEEFQIGLSKDELAIRVHSDSLIEKHMLGIDAPEYLSLAEGDKKALQHLVKAAYVLEPVFLKQDNDKNIPFRRFLTKEAKKGNKDAEMALKLFDGQKGINALDRESNKIALIKDEKILPGKAFYPRDLEQEEFHNILSKMLDEGKDEEVKTILNQRSMVVRDGKGLKAIDFTDAFSREFQNAAKELELAAQHSTNADFNEFLHLQAKALKENNPMHDAYAEKKWSELQDTPLEFTITRENYDDEMTGTVVENEKLAQRLKEKGITAVSKDYLGIRVGIINNEGTEQLFMIKKYLPELAKEMPFADRYEQNISTNSSEIKQAMVDVDIVSLHGDTGAWRGGITLAENLPNEDKLSLTIGGGRRNVYHRQLRQGSDLQKIQQKLDAILEKEQHQFFEEKADHWFTIGHENGHSLGPNKGMEALGKNKAIFEEGKADMAAISMLDKLQKLGMYTEFQKKQIITSFTTIEFLKAKPNLSQAHRVRAVIQMNHFLNEGAIKVSDKGLIHIEYDKIVPAARKLLEKFIEIQLSGDFTKGEKFVQDNFIWTYDMEKVAQKLRNIDKVLNGTLKSPLAQKLLRSL